MADCPESEEAATGAARPAPVLLPEDPPEDPPEDAAVRTVGPLPVLLEAPTPPWETRETLGLTGVFGPPRTVVAPLAPLGLMAVVGPPLGLVPLEPQAAGPRAPRRPPLRQPRWKPDQALKKTISRDPLRLTSITLTFLYATPILPPGSSFHQRY